ncbi:MAG: hypothetical protein UIH41_06360, partial [Treponemataceae bacterium]|nr:hypothetical protein [Treponemataceae bacterium]
MIHKTLPKKIILSLFLCVFFVSLYANQPNISIDYELISLCSKISKEYKDGTNINIEKATELIKELLVVTNSFRDSTLYTFSQVHEIPNYQNILQIEKVALKTLSELEQNKTENISNLFMELQNAIINYLSQINSDFTYSSKILTIVLLISVVFCVAIIWVSLSHVKTTKEKNILKDKVLENEFITKTDWGLPEDFSVDTWPVQSQMKRYIGNVHKIKAVFPCAVRLPASMENLNW